MLTDILFLKGVFQDFSATPLLAEKVAKKEKGVSACVEQSDPC